MRKTCTAVFVLTLVASAVPSAHAQFSGSFDETAYSASVGSGGRALAMGGAFIAIADDATAAMWNPAGLAHLTRPEASLVWRPYGQFKGSVPGFTEVINDRSSGLTQEDRYAPYEYRVEGSSIEFGSVTFPIRRGSLNIVPQVSFYRAVDLGADQFQGAQSVNRTVRRGQSTLFTEAFTFEEESAEPSGGLDVIAGSVGVRVGEKFLVGTSLNFWRNGQSRPDARTKVSGMNGSVGVIFKPVSRLSLGGVFKTASDFDLDEASTDGSFEPAAYTVTWPRSLGVGVAFAPTDRWTLSFDVTDTKWSDSKVTLDGDVQGYLWPSGDESQTDGRQLRGGVEYVFAAPQFLGLKVLPLRAGFFTDRQLIDQTSTYTGVTAGFGLGWSRVILDVAYVHEVGENRSRVNQTFTTGDGSTIAITVNGPEDVTVRRLYVSTIVRF